MPYVYFRNLLLLPVTAVLLIGLLLATSVVGQEEVLNSVNLEPDGPTELDSDVLSPSVMQVDVQAAGCETECNAGQLVLTSQSCLKKAPVYVCPADDVWLISARQSHCAPYDLSRMQCSRLENGDWKSAQLDELVHLHSTDKTKVTMIYVHGNRTSLKWASSRGLQFYTNALQSVKRPPMRFVIFAWQSETERARVIVDYNIKSNRSVAVGKAFSTLLCKFEDREMVIGGYSLGAQVVLTALTRPESQLPDLRPGKYRVAILAPALNSDFLRSELFCYPQNPFVYQTEVFLNRNDRAVKLARTIARRRNMSRLTIRDLAGSRGVGPNAITICNITSEVSCRHSILNYGRSATVNRKLAMLLNATLADCTSLPVMVDEPDETTDCDAESGKNEIAASEPVVSIDPGAPALAN